MKWPAILIAGYVVTVGVCVVPVRSALAGQEYQSDSPDAREARAQAEGAAARARVDAMLEAELPKDDLPESKLLHFNSPSRIPDRYLVQFHRQSRLAELKNQGLYSDDDLPADNVRAAAVAGQLAEQVHGRVLDVLGSSEIGIIVFMEIDDARVLEVARDPRIFIIEPDQHVSF